MKSTRQINITYSEQCVLWLSLVVLVKLVTVDVRGQLIFKTVFKSFTSLVYLFNRINCTHFSRKFYYIFFPLFFQSITQSDLVRPEYEKFCMDQNCTQTESAH